MKNFLFWPSLWLGLSVLCVCVKPHDNPVGWFSVGLWLSTWFDALATYRLYKEILEKLGDTEKK